ncbi:MAG: hypothetical protein HP002_00435 [Lentisphaeria bacterium]|uniref:type II secretion system protein GspD n=1 Tax=uncultured Victivallis sp. TaxID=354118 RepID=UPI001DA60EAD|nr:hypothetical protein [uncultured Victivallis sp.]MBS1451825.1 hypothetical protein [Lentisphaeria bacterium]MBS5530629.1 hypothetical protein [bacterium]
MKYIVILSALGFALPVLRAAETPAPPRDSNFGNTDAYGNTRVEVHLQVPVKDEAKVVHFVRDNNDPRVVTKAYLLKHVDAYEIRDYLRQMVQSKRVGNTSLQQIFPMNTTALPYAATTSSAELTTPATAQPGYNPPLQLGSNTAVECLKYADGTGLLIISAEEYRFKNHENGMGFDSLVEFLDKPTMGENLGTQTFFYIPKFVPARNLMPMIENVGMNVTDVTEIWQGQDLVAYDPDLNWLVFDVTNYSQPNIEKMLAEYDVPIPEVRLKITVYELYHENDDKIGLDFQAWKNNQGADFFSVGGRYRDNWAATYGGAMGQTGSERTSFYNFNPKWNSRYLDFLTSKGHAKVTYTGELCIRNNTPALLDRKTQIFYVDTSKPAGDATAFPDMGVGPYELLSKLIGREIADNDLPVGKGNRQEVEKFTGFGFTMKVENASVNLAETRFTISLTNSSLIGFESNGTPRISSNSVVSQDVSLPYGRDSFVIGGLRKQEEVKSESGIPILKSIPWIGYLFSTKSTSIKHSELVVLGECEWAAPMDNPQQPAKSKSQTTP